MRKRHPGREEDFTFVRGKTKSRKEDEAVTGSQVHSCVFCGFVTCYEERLEAHVADVHFVGVSGGGAAGSGEAVLVQVRMPFKVDIATLCEHALCYVRATIPFFILLSFQKSFQVIH